MKRRIIAALAAVLLASIGAVLLLGYAAGADRRALAGVRTLSVLVVTAPIPKDTPGSQLGKSVQSKLLPATAVATGALSDLSKVSALVTTVDLQPGEQLLASRFAAAGSTTGSDALEVPKGMQRLTVLLEPRRVLGGHLSAGARVAVYVSLSSESKETHLLLDRALVTDVQGGVAASVQNGDDSSKGPSSAAPAGSVMVTFALTAAQAEKVVFASEYELIWLALQPTDAAATKLAPATRLNVFK